MDQQKVRKRASNFSYPLTSQHWLLHVSVHANAIAAGYSYIGIIGSSLHKINRTHYMGTFDRDIASAQTLITE